MPSYFARTFAAISSCEAVTAYTSEHLVGDLACHARPIACRRFLGEARPASPSVRLEDRT